MTSSTNTRRAGQKSGKKSSSFRVGRVRDYLRGRVWYLCYYEQGRRHQPRVGPDRDAARQLAAEINAKSEVGAPSALGFEPISASDLRARWLDHHEHVRRSSLQTIRRYRTTTEHLLNFVTQVRPLRRASDFRPMHAEEFVRYLRSLQVAPNGHSNAAKRRLRDKGIKYILETCSTLFNYAARNRHLPPYADNPFGMIEISRIPVEDSKPIVVLTPEDERRFLEACDDWQFPIFATLLMTGLRPGELTHLLLPDNLDLDEGWLYVRNKPGLGWRVKTRNERDIPLLPPLVAVLRLAVGERCTGPLFRQRRCADGHTPPLEGHTPMQLEREVLRRIERTDTSDRQVTQSVTRTVWRDIGALKEDWIRKEFMCLTDQIGVPEITAPKTLRHTFATCLQDANVDPLVRNELMGHAPGYVTPGGVGLGMTAVYTHTRPETKRRQLAEALAMRPANELAAHWSQCPDVAGRHQIARGIATEDGELPDDADLATVLDAAAGLTRYEAEGAFSLSLVRAGRITPQAVWELKAGMLKKSGLLSLYRGGEDFSRLGGLSAVKAFCKRSLLQPGRHNPRRRPRGVLLLGIPGSGKSAFAKALGNETNRPTLVLDIGALLGSLVGQTEQNVRLALRIADAMAPCILFCDEIEKALSGVAGSGQTDSGVSARMFGTLLSWMNDHTSDVYLIATCNDISKLPPEFTRAERFDAVVFLDLPGREEKEAIWSLYRTQFEIDRDQRLPDDASWTGAEIRACCRLASLLDVPLIQAAQNVVPVAVTAAESVERLRTWASGRCLSTDQPGIYRYEDKPPKTRRRVNRDPSNN